MDTSDLKVVACGASAGGVEALSGLFRAIPTDLPAAFFVVLHVPAHSPSDLHRLLKRETAMPVVMPEDGALIEPGTIYVATPDRHLMVREKRIRVTRGPKECRVRPAIDVLFRSAASAFGSRAIGVLLSGTLDDGTAGLWAIKDKGGLTLVQDPQEAMFGSMPQSAIDNVQIDFVGRLTELATKIQSSMSSPISHEEPSASERHAIEDLIAADGNGLKAGIMKLGQVSKYTCPDCHGVLVQIEEGRIVRFRCHTGHAYSLQTLLTEVKESIDTGLWVTLRAIEERVMLLKQAGGLAEEAGQQEEAQHFQRQAEKAERNLEPVRALLMAPESFGHSD